MNVIHNPQEAFFYCIIPVEWSPIGKELLIFNLSCFILPILILIVLGLFVFTVYMLFGGGNKLRIKRRDETSHRFLQEKTPTLLPWQISRALTDMSSLCDRTGESSSLGGGWSHCRGTVQSLNNQRDAWLVYTVNTQQREGTVDVHTSANKLLVTVSRGLKPRGTRYAEIKLDGHTLGGVNIDTKDLYDEIGRPLGKMTGGHKIIMGGMTNFVTVIIEGREIAQMNTEMFSRFERLGPTPPVFRYLDSQLSAEEEWWLVALLAIALYRDCLSPSV
jgi:hypothetical protein